jgi:hypothetical protein
MLTGPHLRHPRYGGMKHMSTIADLEQELLSAMRSHDTVTLDRLLADDLLFTDHLGRHITEHASGRMTIDELVPSEQVIRELPKAAVVSVRLYIRGTYEQVPFEGHIRYTRFWMLRERRWQVVGGHSSVVV